MESRQKRPTYSVGVNLKVVEYAKQYENRAAGRHFGNPQLYAQFENDKEIKKK